MVIIIFLEVILVNFVILIVRFVQDLNKLNVKNVILDSFCILGIRVLLIVRFIKKYGMMPQIQVIQYALHVTPVA